MSYSQQTNSAKPVYNNVAILVFHSESPVRVASFLSAVRVYSLHCAIRILSSLILIIMYLPLAIRELHGLVSVLLQAYHCAVREDALLRAIREDVLDRLVRESDFLGPVWVQLLCLVIWKLQNFQSIRIVGVSRLVFSIVVDYTLVWHDLLDVSIEEGHNDGLAI